MAEVTRRLSKLAEVIRAGGDRELVHCAWCDRLNVHGEWLDLDLDGLDAAQFSSLFFDLSSHGICPTCFDRVQWQADAERRGRRCRLVTC